MKAKGRTGLYCHKLISGGIIDSFSVVVMDNKKVEARAEYERRGYKVVE